MVYVANQKTPQIARYYFGVMPPAMFRVCRTAKLHRYDPELFLEYIQLRDGNRMNFFAPGMSELEFKKQEAMILETIDFIMEHEETSRALNWFM